MDVIRVLAERVASGIVCCLVNILTSMSGSTLAFSTLAQFFELGTNRLFLAAPKNTWLSPVPRPSSEVVFGMTPPTVAMSVMCFWPVSIPTHALARSMCLLLADARSEEHTSELQSRLHLVCRLLLEKKKEQTINEWYN